MMPDLSRCDDARAAVTYLARTRHIDHIIPLDDYDVETAASLREHLRVPGMGETTARYFRDKLAMRVQTRDKDLLVPEFVPVFNYDTLREFMARVPPPWLLKPRSEAASAGIKKIETPEELWTWSETLRTAGSTTSWSSMSPETSSTWIRSSRSERSSSPSPTALGPRP